VEEAVAEDMEEEEDVTMDWERRRPDSADIRPLLPLSRRCCISVVVDTRVLICCSESM
jgi:hypothetical protein